MLVQGTAAHKRFLHEAYFEYLIEHGIHDRDTLADFNQIYFNFSMPRTKFCEYHDPPFEFIAKQFFEETATTFGFANRSGGKTQAVAVLNGDDMLFKPGVDICSAGAIQEQATRGYEYLLKLFDQLAAKVGVDFIVRSTRAETLISNGSLARVIVASWHGLNSPHPSKFRVDEIELIHPSLLQEAFSMSQTKGGYRAQDTLTSTRKFPSGTVQKLLEEKDTRHIHVVSWCIFETVQRCTFKCKGDERFGGGQNTCPAYSRLDKEGNEVYLCGLPTPPGAEPDGKAHHVKPGGWYLLDDFIKKAGLLDAETFRSQWLNEKPSAGALVYGLWFGAEPPCVVPSVEAAELLERARTDGNWARVYGIDFGINFACGYWMRDPHSQVWYKYAEYFTDTDRPLAEHATRIRSHDPLGWNPSRTYIFADPSGRQLITDLAKHGMPCIPANNDRAAGISHIKFLMQDRTPQGLPKFRVFSGCKHTIRELTMTYMHRLKKDGTVDRDAIADKDDHNCDADRYALYSFITIGTGQYRMTRLRGVF